MKAPATLSALVAALLLTHAQSTNPPPPLPKFSGPAVAHSTEFSDTFIGQASAGLMLRTQTNWIGGPTRFYGEHYVNILGATQAIQLHLQQGIVNTSHIVKVNVKGTMRELPVGDWGRAGEVERVFRMEGTKMLVLTNATVK